MAQPTSVAHDEIAAFWDWDLITDRIHFSPRWLALIGCEHHEVGSLPGEWFDRVHPDDRAQVLQSLDAARANGSSGFSIDHRLCQKSGAFRWVTCRGVVVRADTGQAIRILGSHSDVMVDTLADPVTDLPNRQLFVDRLTHCTARAQRNPAFHFAVLLIDISRAGSVARSDSVSDNTLLTAVARRLETCLRGGVSTPSWRDNDLVSRLSTGQFGVLLEGLTDIANIHVIGDRILRELLAPFDLCGQSLFLTASIGIAVSATGYMQAGDVLRDAETALHRARGLGGSRCAVFDTAIVRSEQADCALESDFEGALDRSEFTVVYQPIVAVDTTEIVGFEALVRWRHPRLGELLPLHFIPIAERTGFIVPLGAWVMRAACLQLRSWQTTLPQAAHVWMSVNLSSVQLRHTMLLSDVSAALHDSGVKASRLVLELTESVAVDNPAAVRTVLMQLRNLGVRISIDDFGTGYSSLAYLSQLPVDTLKIDKSFIHGIQFHEDKATILRTLAAMARQLRLHVVAEGIEHEEHLVYLRAIDCQSAQGFLFAKPVDGPTATALLTTGLPHRVAHAPQSSTLRSLYAPVRGQSGRWRAVAAGTSLLLLCSGLVWLADNRQTPTSLAPLLPIENVNVPPDAHANVAPEKTESLPATPLTENQEASLKMVHLHRLGRCEGRLVVSRGGIVFTPATKTSHDSLRFDYHEFLYAVSDDTLTIKSHAGNYRFRAAQSPGGSTSKVALRELATAITKFLPR